MGACASVPKAMRGEAAAPAPEIPKEETQAAVVEETPAVTEEAKPEEATEKKAEAGKEEESQSLGTLLVEGEAAKEESSSEPKIEEAKESKTEVLPVSEPATSEVKAAAA